jgi:hypothetical protein
MVTTDWLILALTGLGIAAMVGIFLTKTSGFGRYTTSLLLLTMVLFVTAIFFAAGKLESDVFANIIFAIAGFAGGLITAKQSDQQLR